MKYIYIFYQYCIALPILIVITIFTAIVTILCFWCKNNIFLVWIQRLWARSVICFCFLPVKVTGAEHLQKGQSYVFVCNHQSYLDAFVIYGWLPVVYKWLLQNGIRKIPFVGVACEVAGHIFVDRSHPRAAYASIQKAKAELQKYRVSTVVFPEGTRTWDGQVAPFKRGAFQIALDLDLPIVPLSLSGCYEAMNRRIWYVSWHKIHLHIGEPIHLTTVDRENRDEVIERVREEVIKNIQ